MKRTDSIRKLTPVAALVAGLFAGSGVAHADSTVDLGSVSAQATATSQGSDNADTTNSSTVWSTKQKQKSTQDVQSITPDQISLFGPDGGGMQSLAILPNVQISGYNAGSVSSRSTISMRGIKVGWNSVPGDLMTNGITAELDGVPLNSLSQGTGWHSPEVPIGALMAGTDVIEGTGNADTRWYNSIGGTIDFIPVQPSQQAGATAEVSYGSFSTVVGSYVLNTGEHDGWSTVFAVANAHSQSVRDTSDYLPSRTTDAYMKTQKKLSNGMISFGLYGMYNDEYRPNMIPTTDVSGVTMNGYNVAGPAYSQQSSGFYATIPRALWFKHNSVEDYVAWSHLDLNLAPDFTMTNLMWFRDGYIRHFRMNDFGNPGDVNVENYNEHSDTYGDKLQFNKIFSKDNTLSFGGYVINSTATNAYNGYNSASGFNNASPQSLGYDSTQNTFWALFLQDNATLFDRLNIVPAVRLISLGTTWTNMNTTAYNTYYPNGNATVLANVDTNPNQATTYVKTEPSIGANYRITSDLNAFANYSIAYTAPTAGNYDQTNAIVSSLQPPTDTTWELGLRYAKNNVLGMDQVSAQLSYYNYYLDHQTITNTIYTPQGLPVVEFGSGTSTYNGEDLSINANINKHWSAFANLGWLSANWNSFYSTHSGQYYNGMPDSNTPNETANVGVTYVGFFDGGTFDTTLWDQYFGKSYLWNNLTGAPTNQSMAAYNLVNLSINAHLTTTGWLQNLFHPQVATVSFDVSNLLNTQYNSTEYISSGGYLGDGVGGYILANPGAPRAMYVSLRLDY